MHGGTLLGSSKGWANLEIFALLTPMLHTISYCRKQFCIGSMDGATVFLCFWCCSSLRDGKIAVLVNCEILTEGFDEPGVNCILMARPTRSEGLYTQVGGGNKLSHGLMHKLDRANHC